MKNRTISLILLTLVVLITFFVFSACGGKKTPPKGEKAKEDQKTAIDLVGAEVIFRTQISLTSSVFYPDEAENARGDKMRARYKDIGVKYNCIITLESYPEANGLADISNAFMTGTRFGDFYEAAPKVLYNMYKVGGVIPMSDVWDTEKIYDGKWGSKAALDTVTFNNDIVGVNSGYWGVPIPNFDGVLYINNRILSEAGQPHPHELDEQGNWNWANLQTIAENVTQKVSEDRSIIALQSSDTTYTAAIYSNGGRFSYVDLDGNYKVAFNDRKVYDAIEWLKELTDKKIIQTATNMNFTDNQNLAFCIMPVWWGYRFNEAENWPINAFKAGGYSWAQFPIGPSGDSNDAAAGGAVLQDRFITLTAEGVYDSKIIGQIIDDIFEPLEGETPTTWKEDFAHTHFYDVSEFIASKTDNSFKKYDNMLQNVNADGLMFMGDLRNTITAAINLAVKGTKTPTEALEALVEQAQAALDKNTVISNG